MTAPQTEDRLRNARKQVLRQFPYGLYGITLRQGEQVHAFLANWLTQVSFEPCLLAVSVENDSRSFAMIQETGKFTVNVLAAGQRELAGKLGKRSRKVPNKMEGVAWQPGPEGRPLLQGALGYLDCEVVSSLPTGDSTLFVAEVLDAAALAEGETLTMAAAGFWHAG